MRERVVKFLATGFGVGLVPVGPGTAGSVLGLGYWWLLVQARHDWVYWLALVAGLLFAVWCAGEAADAMRRPDPPSVVIDEIAAVPLALAGLGTDLWKIAVAFVLFRIFDVVKPTPAREAQAFSGGVGIVLDDVIAALYACAAAHALVWGIHFIKH